MTSMREPSRMPSELIRQTIPLQFEAKYHKSVIGGPASGLVLDIFLFGIWLRIPVSGNR